MNNGKLLLGSVAILVVAWLALNELRYQLMLSVRNESITSTVSVVWYLISFCTVFAIGPLYRWLEDKTAKKMKCPHCLRVIRADSKECLFCGERGS